MIPNFHLYLEADLISVTTAGLINEYEIKCSRSDFLREFKSKAEKHGDMKFLFENKKSKYTHHIPNYFFFVAPEGLIKPEEIPEYSGHIEIKERVSRFRSEAPVFATMKKRAPRLHREKITEDMIKRICHAFTFRYWNIRRGQNEI